MEQRIQKGIKVLRQGGIVAFPTDTVYGLGCDASNLEAVKRIYKIKQRPSYLALPILLADISQMAAVADWVPETAWRLAERFLPGGLTLVLTKAASVAEDLTAGQATVAVGGPTHPVAIALIRGLGGPIVGTSANISGRSSALTAEEVSEQLGGEVDLIIDGGKCSGEVESTVVDVTSGIPEILRQGVIPQSEIEAIWEKYAEEVCGDAYCFGL